MSAERALIEMPYWAIERCKNCLHCMYTCLTRNVETKSFEGAVVIDVGCGTGILSMMSVLSGARHVYALEMSDIADEAVKESPCMSFSFC